MLARSLISMAAVVALAGGLVACDKIKGMMGGVGGSTDFRNAQIDVSGTGCADNGKFSTLVLKDGKFELAQYQFELFGDTKTGDVSGGTTATDVNDSAFVGNCANDGQTSQVLFVYGPDGKRLGTVNLTDNGKGLVQSYDIKDKTILVEQNLGNPPQLSKTNYALMNGKLADTASPTSPTTPASTAVASSGDTDVDIISFQSFHDKLQPYGKWVDHPRWGWTWHPYAANFRPYENGHWEDSDENGAVWVSADAWGDTPYHYGRWGYDSHYGGWLWQPGYVWGPSWVVWRADDENLGWFPIPPGEWDGVGDYPDRWSTWYGYEGTLDAAAFYGLWAFVPAVDIFAGNVRERIIDRRGNGRFIGRTRSWGHYGLEHGHLVSRAFDRGRFAANFHHGLPGGMRHDFHDHGVHSFAAGRHIAEHERIGGGGAHIGVHEHFGTHVSSMHRESGFNRSSPYHSTSFSRSGHESGGFAHSGSSRSSGFSRSGGEGGGAFGRSNNSGGGGGMFGHSNNSGGGGAFGHASNSGGGGVFSHSNSGGGGGGVFGHSNNAGGGSSHTNSSPSNSGGGGHHHH